MTARITCLGGAVLDLIYGVDELPAVDGKFAVRSYAESGGGMAANAAVIVSRLGGQGVWCGRVGDDGKGRRILDGLRAESVDIRTARIIAGSHSSHSVVLKDSNGNRAILLYRPEELDTDATWLPIPQLLDADAVLTDNRWVEGSVAVLQAAREKGLPSIVDIDSAGCDQANQIVKLATHAIFSRPGLAALYNTDDPDEGLRRAAKHAPFVAVTLGPLGIKWLDPSGRTMLQPSYPVEAVETVGAGDIFHGAFAFALASGRGEPEAIRFAAATAALKCAAPGGRASFPDLDAVNGLLNGPPPITSG